MSRRAVLYLAVVALIGCSSGSPSAPSVPPTPSPSPSPAPAAVIQSFTLTQTSGTIRGSDLGWTMELNLARQVPGLFVRVDLQTGDFGSGDACYASELTYPTPVGPGPGARLAQAGFTKSPRPGSSCADSRFRPSVAFVRVFATADPLGQTPVASGQFAAFITVTE